MDIVERLEDGQVCSAAENWCRNRPAMEQAAYEITRLRAALERVMIGGNHLGLVIGADHPPAGTDWAAALNHYGPGDKYEVWCCWNEIMQARAALKHGREDE